MSLPPPPLPAASLRRSCRLFWCHRCRHPVHILFSSSSTTSDILCPRCSDQFLHELNLPLPLPPPPPPPQFLEDFPFPQWSLPLPPPPPPPPPHNYYFTGPNLDGLINDVTQNDRPGPPPAPASAIEALPTVSITAEHLRDGSQCPVCKEEFAVGEEATEMPCRHAYHSDCIVPWLHLHNSCPVCRFELPDAEPAGRNQSRIRGGGGGGGGYRRQLRPGMWSPFAMLLWPFRGSWHPGWEQYHRFAGDQREEDGSSLILHLAAYVSLLVCLVYFLL